jgi:hypothetical protein
VVGIRYWVLGSYWGFRFFSLQRSGIFVAIIGGLIFSAPAERYYFWSDYDGEGGVGSRQFAVSSRQQILSEHCAFFVFVVVKKLLTVVLPF